MDNTITKLMDVRHAAFVKAREGGFQIGADVVAFREANRAYVAARLGIHRAPAEPAAKRVLSSPQLAKMQAARTKKAA